MGVFDGILVPVYETHCRGCEFPALGLGSTVIGAQNELRRMRWKKVNRYWFCADCKDDPTKTAPRAPPA
jgi:hypothetical protein